MFSRAAVLVSAAARNKRSSMRKLHRASSLLLTLTASPSLLSSNLYRGFCIHASSFSPSNNQHRSHHHHHRHHNRDHRLFTSSNTPSPENNQTPPNSPPPIPHHHHQTPTESQMTIDALSITQAGIDAVDPSRALLSHLTASPTSSILTVHDPSTSRDITYASSSYDRILLVAFGKASAPMAMTAVDLLRDAGLSPSGGIVVVKDHHATPQQVRYLEDFGVEVREASHPVPDLRGVNAGQDILRLVSSSGSNPNNREKTLVITLVSGGGSALFCTPRPPVTLDDLATVNERLLRSGMSIHGMNAVRKRLELGKGGGWVRDFCYPATCLTLVLSDVVGDDLRVIASGVSVEDDDDDEGEEGGVWRGVWKLVERYGLHREGGLPKKVLQVLRDGLNEEEEQTKTNTNNHQNQNNERTTKHHPAFTQPKPDGLGGRISETILVGNNALAVSAAAKEAEARGYHPVVLGTTIEGEARFAAEFYVAMAAQLRRSSGGSSSSSSSSSYPIASLPVALIAGGETTVSSSDDDDGRSWGKGGRNQELALAAALKLSQLRLRNVVLASVGTDGTDGPTDAAGAVVDGGTVGRIEGLNGGGGEAKEALRGHDAYNFFDRVGEGEGGYGVVPPLVKIGPTGTNVADICVTLIS